MIKPALVPPIIFDEPPRKYLPRSIPKKFTSFNDHNPQLIQKLFKIKRCKSYRYQEWDCLDNDKLTIVKSKINKLKLMSISKCVYPQLCRIYSKKIKDLNSISLHNLSCQKLRVISGNMGLFKYSTSFQYVHFLDYVKMTDGLYYMMKGLKTNKILERLKLTLPKDCITQRNMKYMANVISRFSSLRDLEITLQGIGEMPNSGMLLSPLPNALKKLSNLESFKIEPSFLPDAEETYIELSQVLQSRQSIKCLSGVIDSNPYCLRFFRATKVLIKNFSSLKMLTLSITWRLNICETLEGIFQKLPALEHLSLTPISFESTTCDWLAFAQAFRNLTELKSLELDLEFCQELASSILKYIEQGVHQTASLEKIKISMNRFELGDEDFTEELHILLKSLPQVSNFQLNASRNRFINDEAMERIGKGIYSLKKLKHLVLNIDQCDGISDRSLQLLRLAIQENRGFQELKVNFAQTNITDEGVKCFSKMFKYTPNISQLGLNFSVEQSVGISSIASIVKGIIKHLRQCIYIKLEVEQLRCNEFGQVKQAMNRYLNPLIFELVGNDYSDTSETESNLSGAEIGQDLF